MLVLGQAEAHRAAKTRALAALPLPAYPNPFLERFLPSCPSLAASHAPCSHAHQQGRRLRPRLRPLWVLPKLPFLSQV